MPAPYKKFPVSIDLCSMVRVGEMEETDYLGLRGVYYGETYIPYQIHGSTRLQNNEDINDRILSIGQYNRWSD